MGEEIKQKRYKVNIVEQFEDTTLIEYEKSGSLLRVIVPRSSVDAKPSVEEGELEIGIPYGIDWSRIKIGVTPKDVSNMLHEAGIYTDTDLLGRLTDVRDILMQIVPDIVSQLINLARSK